MNRASEFSALVGFSARSLERGAGDANEKIQPMGSLDAPWLGREGICFAGIDNEAFCTGNGVYRSEDNGEHGIAVNAGLIDQLILSLAINSSGHIFAGAQGSGVFISAESTTSIDEVSFSATMRLLRSAGND